MVKEVIDIVEPNSSENEDGQVKPLDRGYKDIGYISAVGLIINRMLGTGIFSTPATIYNLAGSIGLSLILWVVGALISLSGLYVYMEFGSAIPRNGGEKNYLEYVFRKPKFLTSAMYASYVFFLGWAAGNSIIFGQYILTAANVEPGRWNQRGLGVACISFAFLVNGSNVKVGAYLQNILGLFKLGVVLFITVTGWVALGGWKKTDNYHNSFEGTGNATAYGVVNALYNIIWSFIGYSNVNYALGEVKNPVKTLKFAGPSALILLAIIYLFVNIAYFAIVPKSLLKTSSTILAADFFEIAFGETGKKASSVFVALSALGNVLSVIFSQGRIIQQLGREGILPFPKFFASSRPFRTPFVGLMQHWIVCIVTILAPPPGDAYNFILNLISYPLNVINLCVSIALLWIHYKAHKGELDWHPPLKATVPVIIFFGLSSLYLIVAPYVPPSEGQSVYNSLPYWTHCVVTWGIFFIGFVYWVFWARVFPKIFKYRLHVVEIIGEDGFWRKEIKRIPEDQYDAYIHEENSSALDNYSTSDLKNKVSSVNKSENDLEVTERVGTNY